MGGIPENFDKNAVPSPSYVLFEETLERNLRVVERVQRETGVTVILALKAFGMHSAFHYLQGRIKGATASSLSEAKLAAEYLGGEVHAYAPAYIPSEYHEIAMLSSHITFNSFSEYGRYKSRLVGASAGLRINPEYSTVKTDLYNPCIPGSRLGIRSEDLQEHGLPEGIEGLHSHNLCESDSFALEGTLKNIEHLYGSFLMKIKWLNLGGGHLMTCEGYDVDHLIRTLNSFRSRYPHLQIYLEPGAAFVWDAGVLTATVLDVTQNSGINNAILDISFACHMPDCLEMPYKPVVIEALPDTSEVKGISYRLGGCSCLAGDFIGDYKFEKPLETGMKITFNDMIQYTMVKTTMFNGINLPSIVIWQNDGTPRLVKAFGYEDYKSRLS